MSMTREDWLFVISETLKSDEVRDLIAWAIDCATEEREEQAYHGYAAAALNGIICGRGYDEIMGARSVKDIMSEAEDFASAAMNKG
jgi:hypothetical protein